MTATNPMPTAEPVSFAVMFDQQPVLARVEVDRFCEHCGYNLREQLIRRCPQTGLFLTRCSECGRYCPATETSALSRAWMRRLGLVGLVLWMLLALVVFAALFGVSFVPMVGMLEESTGYRRYEHTVPDKAALEAYREKWGRIHYRTNPSGDYTIFVSERFARELDFELVAFQSAMLGLSMLIGLCMMMAQQVFFHHWRRVPSVLFAVVLSLAPGSLVAIVGFLDGEVFGDHEPILVLMCAACLLAGALVGVVLGRPLARVAIRVLLPPRIRGSFSFLWLADGMQPPPARDRAPASAL